MEPLIGESLKRFLLKLGKLRGAKITINGEEEKGAFHNGEAVYRIIEGQYGLREVPTKDITVEKNFGKRNDKMKITLLFEEERKTHDDKGNETGKQQIQHKVELEFHLMEALSL